MSMTASDIRALITLFQDSGLKEMHLIYEGDELFLSRNGSARIDVAKADTAAPVAPVAAAAPAAVSPVAAPKLAPVHAIDRDGWTPIKAANLGTFYRAPTPESPAYVEVGQSVEAETEVCLIEVMKLFTTLQAGVSGVVREIAVADGDMVEFDQILMWVEPKAAA